MQRARSSSCIPVPQNCTKRLSKPSIGGRPRSTSVSRASGSKGLTPKGPTPLQHKRLFSTSTTPSYSSAKKKCKIFNGVSPKKLWNDKKWVAVQYARVRDYVIRHMILFDSSLVSPDQLKPPPLKSFIHIVTVLLGTLILKVDPVNQINYKEVVTRYLKMLNCPVIPSMSTLKIVSSMHVFPQIMTLLTWMIDFADSVIEELSVENVPEDFVLPFQLQATILTHFCQNYNISVPDAQNYQVLRLNCDEILGVDTATLNKLEKKASDNEKSYQKIEEKFNLSHEEKLKLELELTNMKDEMIDFENEEIVFAENISNLNPDIEKVEVIISNCERSMKELRGIVKTQKMSFKEQQCVLKEINDLKNELARISTNQSKINKIRDELDLQHSALQSQVQAEVDQWNISLLRASPEYQKMLRLREKGFHCLDFLQEINEVEEKKSELEDQVNKQIEDIKKKLYEVSTQLVSAKNRLETETKSVATLDSSIKQLKDQLAQLENYKHKLSGDIKAHLSLQATQTKKIKEANAERKKKEIEIMEVKANNIKLIEEKQNFMIKGTSFFVQYHLHIMTDVENMHVAIKNIRTSFTNKLNEQSDTMAQQIKYLEDLQTYSKNPKQTYQMHIIQGSSS